SVNQCRRPCRSAKSRAWASVADVTATTSAPGTVRNDSTWIELTNWEPTRPTRIVFMIVISGVVPQERRSGPPRLVIDSSQVRADGDEQCGRQQSHFDRRPFQAQGHEGGGGKKRQAEKVESAPKITAQRKERHRGNRGPKRVDGQPVPRT